MKKITFLLAALGIVGQTMLASTVGIGYGVTSSIYHSDENGYVLPLIDVEYNDFFIKGSTTYGLALGYKVLEEDNYVLSLYGVPFGGFSVEASDMKDGYKNIDDRDTKFMGGAELVYYPGYFNIVTSVSGEYGEEGGNLSLRVSRPYRVTDKFTVVPTLNYTYYNSDLIDYYFGVEPHELDKNILYTYDGKAAHRYGIGLLGDYRFNDSISIVGFTGVTKLSSGITNSPISDKEIIYLFGTGVVYTF